MFKISGIGPAGHMMMTRNTPSDALRKALELAAAGFGNVRIADRTGRLHAPEAFDRFFVSKNNKGGPALRNVDSSSSLSWPNSRQAVIGGSARESERGRSEGQSCGHSFEA
jgi:hypothetical protein